MSTGWKEIQSIMRKKITVVSFSHRYVTAATVLYAIFAATRASGFPSYMFLHGLMAAASSQARYGHHVSDARVLFLF
jgi:hypothetical protein